MAISFVSACSDCGKRIQVRKGQSAAPVCQRCRRERKGLPPAPPRRMRGSPKPPKPPKPVLVPRPCSRCDTTYQPRMPHQRYCSRECHRAADNAATRHQAKARKRRLRQAQTWDGITDPEILDRDAWRCQVPGCKRRPIRKDLKYPHPRSKSIDHIVPLAHGGDDTAANKRAAHLGCNIARSANMGTEQMALFGSLREAPLVPAVAGEARRGRRSSRVRLCGTCGEAMPGRKCELHMPVRVRSCDSCGCLFAFQPGRGGRKFCEQPECKRQRANATQRRRMISPEERKRKRRRDRERRWVDPAYRERANAATARFHERRRAAKVAPAAGQNGLWAS